MVVAAEKYVQLTNLAVAAALDPRLWQQFVNEAGCALGTRVCTQLMGYDQSTRMAPLAYTYGYDPHILHLYETHYADKNPFAANFDKCAIGDSISTHQLCPPEELKKTQFYADLLLPHDDIHGGGGTMLALDEERMFLIGGNIRAKDRDKYEQNWLRLCVSLAPVIRQSLEINRTISGLAFEKWAAEQHMLGSSTAILVVDPSLRIHFTSQEADTLLADGRLFGSGFDRRLQFRSEKTQSEFSSFARMQSKGEGTIFKNWLLTDEEGKRWTCRTIGMRLADLDETPFGAFLDKSISAMLLAVKPDVSQVSLRHRIQHLFGLSQTEAETALLLANGQTLTEIAATRRVSIHTVRNQVKAALAKSSCRRQSELVRKIEQARLRG